MGVGTLSQIHLMCDLGFYDVCIFLFSFCLNVTGGGVVMCGSGEGENRFCICFAHVSILFECDKR